MYANLAYLGKVEEDIVDLGSPLLITAVGYYRIHSSLIRTWREKGRGDYQPSCSIPLFHGTAQIGKVVNNEYPASRLQCHLLDASDDCLLEVGIKEGIAIERYTVQPFGKGVQIAMVAGVTELELFFG